MKLHVLLLAMVAILLSSACSSKEDYRAIPFEKQEGDTWVNQDGSIKLRIETNDLLPTGALPTGNVVVEYGDKTLKHNAIPLECIDTSAKLFKFADAEKYYLLLICDYEYSAEYYIFKIADGELSYCGNCNHAVPSDEAADYDYFFAPADACDVLTITETCNGNKKVVCTHRLEAEQQDAACVALQEFYQAYITEGAKNTTDGTALHAIKEKYVTKNLLSELQQALSKGELDYDPFVNAQDFNFDWLGTLEISKDKSLPATYHVSYANSYEKDGKTHIKVAVVNEGGRYKISKLHFDESREEAVSGQPIPESWHGYYRGEVVGVPIDSVDLGGQGISYAIEITSTECTYYKIQYRATEIYPCQAVEATDNEVSFSAIGEDAPDTDGKPLATLYRDENGSLYIKDPFVCDKDGRMGVAIKVEKKKKEE